MKLIPLILTTLFLIGCSNSSNKSNVDSGNNFSVKNIKPGVGNIVVIGDSLAAGYKATENSVKPKGCLATLQHSSVYDLAVPGTTSREVLKSTEMISVYAPKLVFVSSGGNDVMYNLQKPGLYPRENTLSEMSNLFDKVLATGAMVVYLSLNPPLAGAERLAEISAMAQAKGVITVDGMNGFWNNPQLMADQIHPNNQGYQIMCQRILSAIGTSYP